MTNINMDMYIVQINNKIIATVNTFEENIQHCNQTGAKS